MRARSEADRGGIVKRTEWKDVCDRIASLWPTRKRIPEGTEAAWFAELGQRVDAELVHAALSRMVLETEKAPGLAALSSAVREMGGMRGKPQERNEAPSEEDVERWARLAADWIPINRCLYDKGVSELLRGLVENDADPGDTRLALLEEIKHRGVKPREAARVRAGELSSIGEALGEVMS
jgi:hypothetical protein